MMTKNIKKFYKHVHHHENGISMPAVSFYVEHDKDTDEMKISWAICSPSDNFCKATGRRIAEDNARAYIYVTGLRDYSLPVEVNILDIVSSADIPDSLANANTKRYRDQAVQTCEQIYLMEAIAMAYEDIINLSNEEGASHNEVYSNVGVSNIINQLVSNAPYYTSRFV